MGPSPFCPMPTRSFTDQVSALSKQCGWGFKRSISCLCRRHVSTNAFMMNSCRRSSRARSNTGTSLNLSTHPHIPHSSVHVQQHKKERKKGGGGQGE